MDPVTLVVVVLAAGIALYLRWREKRHDDKEA